MAATPPTGTASLAKNSDGSYTLTVKDTNDGDGSGGFSTVSFTVEGGGTVTIESPTDCTALGGNKFKCANETISATGPTTLAITFKSTQPVTQVDVVLTNDMGTSSSPIVAKPPAVQDLGVGVAVGHLYLSAPDNPAGISEEDKVLAFFFGAPAVAGLPNDNEFRYAGFDSFNRAVMGDTVDVQVTVTNYGKQEATFAHALFLPKGATARLVGYYHPRVIDTEIRLTLGNTNKIAPSDEIGFIYAVSLGNTGAQDLHARIYDIAPSDSNPKNNDAVTVVTVDPRPRFSSVAAKTSGTGATITGKDPPPSKASHRRAAVDPSAVYIAVLHKVGSKCSWLTGHSGSFTTPSLKGCINAVFLLATGTSSWSYKINKRPSDQTDTVLTVTGGEHERDFGTSLGDSFAVPFS